MARKDVSAIISGAGWIADFSGQLIRGLKEQGVSDQEIHALVTSKGKLPMERIITEVSREIRRKTVIAPPEGGKIHIVSVFVDEARPWDQAVRTADPNTPESYAVWKVGDQYPPQQFKNDQEIILVNFGKYISSEDVIEWGRGQKLRPATPRSCFAVGEHILNLHTDLGVEYMAVVSLVQCSFGGSQRVCGVWRGRSGRGVGLCWFGSDWSGSYWFAFVREQIVLEILSP